MGLLDSSSFKLSAAGQMLRRLAEADAGGAPPDALDADRDETGALLELERQGYVRLVRGAGAQAWRIVRVEVTDLGRAKLEEA